MAHYAFIDENNIVTEVITGRDENEVVDGITDWEEHYSMIRVQPCRRTSFNTVHGVHLNGGTPFRQNFAGIGYFYDDARDAFIPPAAQCHPEETLDEETCSWVCENPEHIEVI